MQWFLKMTELAKPALDSVMNDDIKFYPPKYKNTYKYWMENVKDWCVSRQLWWGHQIPAYFLPKGGYVVAQNIDEALEKAKAKTGDNNLTVNDLRQDADCLDTWFSSWLWPISLFDGINKPGNAELKYYYPSSDLVTAPDIIFFWVARMIMAGYEYMNDKPFKNVYFTGIVRDKIGRKMSKSLGNSPDPIELIDKYGADGVRMGMMLSAPAGNDILFDEALCEQGRNFNNKIWNALRLVKGWEVADIEQPASAKMAISWFEAKLNQTIEKLNAEFANYRISEALMTVYKLFWDEFSAWYLELIKPAYQQPIDRQTFNATIGYFEKLTLLLHPFMPFITEEIWQTLAERKEGESIMVAQMPEIHTVDTELLEAFEITKEVVANLRTIRKEKNIPQKESLCLSVIKHEAYCAELDCVIKKLCNVEAIDFVSEKVAMSAGFITNKNEYFVPVGNLINKDEELKKLQEDLAYAEKFLASVVAKLSNENFVSHAPAAVIDKERKKQSDAETKIRILKEQIAALQ